MSSRHKFIYIPHINPYTFLLFYFDNKSWSLRDFSRGSDVMPIVIYPKDLSGLTATQILETGRAPDSFCFDAPRWNMDNAAFWHTRIVGLNEKYLRTLPSNAKLDSREGTPRPVARRVNTTQKSQITPRFPILAFQELSESTKAHRRQNWKRILTAPNSEDYVTWNVLMLLRRLNPKVWWQKLIELARSNAPKLGVRFDLSDLPTIEWLELRPAPREYKRLVPAGPTEVDLIFTGQKYIVHIEAKLDADISSGTRHSATHNQILRNIDIALEHAGRRQPCLWLFVRDDNSYRDYVQKVQQYQTDPDVLKELLPYRDAQELRLISNNLAIILWTDLYQIIQDQYKQQEMDDLTLSVLRELQNRFSLKTYR